MCVLNAVGMQSYIEGSFIGWKETKEEKKGEFCFDYCSKKLFKVSGASRRKLQSKKWDKNTE